MGLTDIAYLCDLSAFSKKFKVSYQDISYKEGWSDVICPWRSSTVADLTCWCDYPSCISLENFQIILQNWHDSYVGYVRKDGVLWDRFLWSCGDCRATVPAHRSTAWSASSSLAPLHCADWQWCSTTELHGYVCPNHLILISWSSPSAENEFALLLSDTEWLKCLEVPQCLHTGRTHLMKAQGEKVPTVVSARFWEAFLVVFKIFAQFLVSGFKYFMFSRLKL